MKKLNRKDVGKIKKMAVLTTKKRKRLKDSSFAIPSERKYPIYDRTHAINALARAAQSKTPGEEKRVRSAVYKKFPSLKKKK